VKQILLELARGRAQCPNRGGYVMAHFIGYKPKGLYMPIFDVLDDDYSKIENIDTSPDGGLNVGRFITGSAAVHGGRKIKPEFVPTKILWESRPNRISDSFTPRTIPCVSERMKSMIEQLEPDVHQFFPVDVVGKEGDLFAKHYFFIVCNRLDSVDRESMPYELIGGRWNGVGPLNVIIFNRRQIGGAHVWIDKYIGDTILVSNALAGAFKKAKLTALEIGPEMQEVG
jgi:hypothetical protein